KFRQVVALMRPALMVAWAVMAASCSEPATRDPGKLVELMGDSSIPDDVRMAADRKLAGLEGEGYLPRIEALERVLQQRGASTSMQIHAMDGLEEADSSRLVVALKIFLSRAREEALARACDLAVRAGDEGLLPALTRSLARGEAEGDEERELRQRPEWHAIEKLFGKPVREALWEMLHDSSGRVAALAVLARVETEGGLVKELDAMGATEDKWLDSVRWWAGAFGTVPYGEYETDAVVSLHLPENEGLMARALAKYRTIAEGGDSWMAPRFVEVLAEVDDAGMGMSRAALLADLRQRLSGIGHMRREPSSPGAMDDNPETLAFNEKRLSRGDLLMVRMLLRLLPGKIAEFGREADADRADVTTEHGGLLKVEQGELIIVPRAPAMAESDVVYETSGRTIREAATGVALYHFHAQRVDNSERAGPSLGDMIFSKETRVNCVVITSVGKGQLDFDYYTPAGAVIDLGVYRY
ncbi:MAG TPA: hypothetical protein VGN88_06005, partial [Phycisphaerae bacterium]